MANIKLVDLQALHQRLKPELDAAIETVIDQGDFIKGQAVKTFLKHLEAFSGASHVIGRGNGTDALQLALMALDLPKGAEVIVPTFNYVSAAEAVAVLGIKPVFADVHPDYFTLDPTAVAPLITKNTAAIIPVHLFGQAAEMAPLLNLAEAYNLKIIEDNAQALGAEAILPDGSKQFLGTLGHLGATSFFPTKVLGAMGDGGAVFTQCVELGQRVQKLTNHGQQVKYTYELIGINSRLDTLQAAVLDVKLRYLEQHIQARRQVANWYRGALYDLEFIQLPFPSPHSTHVFHQFTIQVEAQIRQSLQEFLQKNGIASAVYYEVPLHLQPAYRYLGYRAGDFPIAENLGKRVLSLPMHPFLTEAEVAFIAQKIKEFFN